MASFSFSPDEYHHIFGTTQGSYTQHSSDPVSNTYDTVTVVSHMVALRASPNLFRSVLAKS